MFRPAARATLRVMNPADRLVRRLAGLLVGGLAAAVAMAAEFPKGKLLEKVACAKNPDYTYALYVPTSFEPTKKWPVLFCFDPGARGRVPVERFMAAAEKCGYIVAGSNNSRNGPIDANVKAINAMIQDVDHYLPLDPARLYAAGLSGGARVACALASNTDLFKGVILCGAAFSGGEVPSELRFVVFGTAGMTDFNYLELRQLDRELDDRKAPHRVVMHAGSHEWLPGDLALDALQWLDLQAMRRGAKPKDPTEIEAQFTARRAAAAALTALPDHHRALRGLVADFKSLTDIGGVEKELSALSASREWSEAAKAERKFEQREEALRTNLDEAIANQAGGAVKKLAADLRTKEAAMGSPEGQMAFRVLQGSYAGCGEQSRELLRRDRFGDAETLLEMMTLMRPERPQAFFDYARCLAHRGDKKKAIAALQQAAAAGFKDTARVESEKTFAGLHGDPAFNALVSAMR